MSANIKNKMEVHKIIQQNRKELNIGRYPYHKVNMSYCIERIVKAINNREKILVFGYYDVDKIASISILMLVLRYLNADVEYYIPNDIRTTDNLTYSDIKDHIKFLGTKLIISIGGNLSSETEAELCRELNMDLIVLSDLRDLKSKYGCVVKPQGGCSGDKCHELSYAGITFKLVQQLGIYYRTNIFNKYIDLACIGTVASGKDITEQNAVIIKRGMDRLNNTRNYGLKAVKEIHNINTIDMCSIKQIVQFLRPRVNAMGNMDDAKIIVELFTTGDTYKAKQIVKYIQG
ncbi:hypothetical protein SAMN02745248_01628 [Hathewaya proteolytica DSM 3090]|uniref:DDH domain-containing protein n=1 Tax=Hathewaya proteolytica DSM 3090 TaxID=1121331 RepID=A0A1M6P8A5_9CLOT|nr:DHH family phosphoesterase [Hathewaya proteolytica]SHK04136.1 hypothetical protein SAMN02745248_01628 [Hathewaya proteolytica DSM 3090]